MKKIRVSFFSACCLFICSCNVLTTAQSKTFLSLEELVTKAPPSIFDYTTEGIYEQEKSTLMTKGESENWKIKNRNKQRIVVEAKNPSSKLSLFSVLTKKKDPTLMNSVLIVFTENERAQNIETLEYKNNAFRNIAAIPKIETADFFKNSNAKEIAKKYPNAYSYKLQAENKGFEVSLSAWQNEELANLKADYKIKLEWNGSAFEKQFISIH